MGNNHNSQKLVTFSIVNRKERTYSSQMNQKIRMCHSIDDRAEEFRWTKVQNLSFYLNRVNGVTIGQKWTLRHAFNPSNLSFPTALSSI